MTITVYILVSVYHRTYYGGLVQWRNVYDPLLCLVFVLTVNRVIVMVGELTERFVVFCRYFY